ncbi:MAG: glutamate--tRNA ligase [Puniceicoccales bacterium]|jgi:glutamyl-tRNA synthetase|nr:glutamate--tRNA ligase [Puniceicoccales bacterium]
MNTSNGQVRVRFAPSPTGFFHIGGARTALFNWLYARHCGGTFVLRIEDTDKKRDSEEALRVLIDGMKWLGLDWDEGPEVGGPHEPYFQSKRSEIYAEYLQQLRDCGRAYDRDGAVWFRVSGSMSQIDDKIRGKVQRLEEKDFVIVRSDGQPVFHFVNVVDDIAMGISHVIRGEDHLSNSSKHVELFLAFGRQPPTFAHIPLILKTNGPGKMSKRDSGALIEDYAGRNYLPEAVRNYLCLLGWSPKDDREILPIEEIIALFDLPGINKNNARFDEKKLAHINGEYLRRMAFDDFYSRAIPLLRNAGLVDDSSDGAYVRSVLGICQEKLRELAELEHFCAYFFRDDYQRDATAEGKIISSGNSLASVGEFLAALWELGDRWDVESLEQFTQKLAATNGRKTGDYIHSIRFAVSGQSVGPGFYAMVAVIGKDRTVKRLENFLRQYSAGNP